MVTAVRLANCGVVVCVVLGCAAEGTMSESGAVPPPVGTPDGATDPPAAMEACDSYDDDGDGLVDEGCSCSADETQPCHAWTRGAAPTCPVPGVQTCSGDGEFGTWGACQVDTTHAGGMCPWWIFGEAAGDGFHIGHLATFGDLNADGALDLAGSSLSAEAIEGADPGRVYALFGGEHRVGDVTDLATTPPDGTDGFRVEGTGMWFSLYTRPTTNHGSIGDVDGDGISDLVVSTRGLEFLAIFGRADHTALYSRSMADGALASVLGGAIGTHGIHQILAVDVDGDGRDDVLSSGANSSAAGGAVHDGLAVWYGRSDWTASTARDHLVAIGIPGIGQGSLHNMSELGGAGDFDGDGQLDVSAGNGAANDTMITRYRSFVYWGGPDSIAISNMTSFAEERGMHVTGGTGRGVFPGHQHGDLDGDGVDDLLLTAGVGGDGHGTTYVVYGEAGVRPAALTMPPASGGFALRSTEDGRFGPGADIFGAGDIDGDGYDELAVGIEASEGLELAIVWGSATRASGEVTLSSGELAITRISLDRLARDVDVPTDPEDLGVVSAVSIADIDGDGLGDVLIGLASADTMNGADSGAGVVIFGRELRAR